jgi:protein gp37
MADLFGNWVPDEWIQAVFDACAAAPQHRYLFLTKNPDRYLRLDKADKLPLQHWYGTTQIKNEILGLPSPCKHFVSIEPLVDAVYISPMAHIDWIIIGAMTGPGAKKHQPKRAWVDEIVTHCLICHIPIFMKDSLRPYWDGELIREFPRDVSHE